MQPMDHTPIDDLLSDLEDADPAEAPPIADEIANALSDQLEEDDGDEDDGDDAAPPA